MSSDARDFQMGADALVAAVGRNSNTLGCRRIGLSGKGRPGMSVRGQISIPSAARALQSGDRTNGQTHRCRLFGGDSNTHGCGHIELLLGGREGDVGVEGRIAMSSDGRTLQGDEGTEDTDAGWSEIPIRSGKDTLISCEGVWAPEGELKCRRMRRHFKARHGWGAQIPVGGIPIHSGEDTLNCCWKGGQGRWC